ncbi:MAG TPA: hypothetical protein VF309_00510 [Usitatibacter sp.]
MTSFFVSTFAFFIGGFFIRRYLDEIGIERTFGRATIVFFLALAIAYGVAFIVDAVASLFG